MRNKLLILVIFTACVLRFWDLGKNPPSINWDEIAIGYDAYSVLKTGKDQFNHFLPLSFRSLDDYKQPVYVYATIPAIMLFGKSEFAIRVTSALSGVLTIYFLYLLTQKILTANTTIKDEKKKEIWRNRSANIALFSAGILAITPWHVHFSRVAFEGNTALMFEVLGAYLFLVWIEKLKQNKPSLKWGLAAVLANVLAIYSYHNSSLFVALLLLGWAIYFHTTLLKNIKHLIIPIVVGLIFALPLLLQIYQGVGLTRYRATSIFYRPDTVLRNNKEAKEDFDAGQGRLSVIMHNIRIPYAQAMIDNYLSHYKYTFLFTKADLPRHQIPGFGLLYNWQLLLILTGFVFLIRNRDALNTFLPLWWLFVAPMPAAVTWQVPHSIRTEVMLPIFAILTGLGIWALLRWIQQKDLAQYNKKQNTFQKIYPKIIFLTTIAIITTSLFQMIISYAIFLPYEFSPYWLYGRKETVAYVQEHKDQYDHIHVSKKLDWMYLWFLWYGNYDPQWYLDQGGTVSGGFEETQNKLGKMEFKPFTFSHTDFNPSKLPQNSLLIGIPEEFPSTLVPEKTIYDLSGKPIIYIVRI